MRGLAIGILLAACGATSGVAGLVVGAVRDLGDAEADLAGREVSWCASTPGKDLLEVPRLAARPCGAPLGCRADAETRERHEGETAGGPHGSPGSSRASEPLERDVGGRRPASGARSDRDRRTRPERRRADRPSGSRASPRVRGGQPHVRRRTAARGGARRAGCAAEVSMRRRDLAAADPTAVRPGSSPRGPADLCSSPRIRRHPGALRRARSDSPRHLPSGEPALRLGRTGRRGCPDRRGDLRPGGGTGSRPRCRTPRSKAHRSRLRAGSTGRAYLRRSRQLHLDVPYDHRVRAFSGASVGYLRDYDISGSMVMTDLTAYLGAADVGVAAARLRRRPGRRPAVDRSGRHVDP